MGNYKGIKFNNTTADFKRWTVEFPPLDADAVRKQSFKRAEVDGETVYSEIQLVKGFITEDAFIHQNFRVYDEESENFESLSWEKENELKEYQTFKQQRASFMAKNKNLLGGIE